MENNIKYELETYEVQKSISDLKKRHKFVLQRIMEGDGYYIWGTGRLGKFCSKQMQKIHNDLKGFIDNDQRCWDVDKKIYSPSCISQENIIIVASVSYPQILEQLDKMGNHLAIYYEELSYILEGINTYYIAFKDIFTELEENRGEYIKIYDILGDDISKEIYKNLLQFRMTLNHKFASIACQLSLQHGIQDFDELIIKKFNKNTCFYDIGGFDGQTSLDFIQRISAYKRIYFFEPDKEAMEKAKKNLHKYSDIEFYPMIVGNKTGKNAFCCSGDGSGLASEKGTEMIDMVCLDNFIGSSDSYIKFDVEGFELAALEGCEQAIRRYKPMLSVSLYHKPGDIHFLINKVLAWNPNYRVYMRHYTSTYADTRAYFIDGSC